MEEERGVGFNTNKILARVGEYRHARDGVRGKIKEPEPIGPHELGERRNEPAVEVLKEICPRGNNKVVIYISLYHDKCLLFMLELY